MKVFTQNDGDFVGVTVLYSTDTVHKGKIPVLAGKRRPILKPQVL